jgi:hypothetical protein
MDVTNGVRDDAGIVQPKRSTPQTIQECEELIRDRKRQIELGSGMAHWPIWNDEILLAKAKIQELREEELARIAAERASWI